MFEERSYARLWVARVFSTVSSLMGSVAVGWQVYALTHSARALGIVGLVQFLPLLLLALVSGYVGDRFNRRTIVSACQAMQGLTMSGLALGSQTHHLTVTGIYWAVTALGVGRAFESPNTQALMPQLVPRARLPEAISWFASATQTASIVGPALGGLLYLGGASVPYWCCAVLYAAAAALSWSVVQKVSEAAKVEGPHSVFAGIRYIRGHRNILGAISLDLFAVLLGGATALLPAYARDILHTGPAGLGLLRLAPAVGALANAVYLARHPIRRGAGLRMFGAVIVFGITTAIFGLSHNFVLSMAMLCVMGAADVTSVVVRSSLVQLETPDAMRGRVSAVNSLFVGTSNQLGQFESGMTAGWWGLVPATVIGGVGSVVVALLWMGIFPGLRELDTLTSLRLAGGPAAQDDKVRR